MPKQLVPVANKPVLEHVLENIRDLGVTEVGIIVGDRSSDIIDAIGDGFQFGVRITYIQQERPLGLAHCVTVARDFLGADDFVMYLGDNVLPEGITEIARDFTANRPAAQVVVHKVAEPAHFGVAELTECGTVSRLVEKPSEPKSDLALIGVYFFTPAIHEAVAAIDASARGELEITDAVQWLASNGVEVRASEYSGYWQDIGDPDGLLDCNRRLLDGLRPAIAGEVDDASVLSGPVVVASGARVVRSRIEGPTIIGTGSRVEDSHVGHYTAVGRDCILRSARIEDSVVLNGSTVFRIHGLHGSLVGRSAFVGTAELDSSAHRLIVGDNTSVEVAV